MKCRTCDNEAAEGMAWCSECAALVNGFMGCLQEEIEKGGGPLVDKPFDTRSGVAISHDH